jgi:hypothetical protein
MSGEADGHTRHFSLMPTTGDVEIDNIQSASHRVDCAVAGPLRLSIGGAV